MPQAPTQPNMQAADSMPSQDYGVKINDLAFPKLSAASPKFVKALTGSDIIDAADDGSFAVAVYKATLGNNKVVVPVIVDRGTVRGANMMFVESANAFVKLDDTWVDKLVSGAPFELGEPVERRDAKGTADAGIASMSASMSGIGGQGSYKLAAEEFAAVGQQVFGDGAVGNLRLTNIIKKAGARFATAFAKSLLESNDFCDAVSRHYDLGDLINTAKVAATAQPASVKQAKDTILFKDNPKVTYTLDPSAALLLSEDDKKQFKEFGLNIDDTRDPADTKGVSQAVALDITSELGFETPTTTGEYTIIDAALNRVPGFVVTNPFFPLASRISDVSMVMSMKDGKPESLCIVDAGAVVADTADSKGKAKNKAVLYDSAMNLEDVELSDREKFLLVGRDGEISLPFTALCCDKDFKAKTVTIYVSDYCNFPNSLCEDEKRCITQCSYGSPDTRITLPTRNEHPETGSTTGHIVMSNDRSPATVYAWSDPDDHQTHYSSIRPASGANSDGYTTECYVMSFRLASDVKKITLVNGTIHCSGYWRVCKLGADKDFNSNDTSLSITPSVFNRLKSDILDGKIKQGSAESPFTVVTVEKIDGLFDVRSRGVGGRILNLKKAQSRGMAYLNLVNDEGVHASVAASMLRRSDTGTAEFVVKRAEVLPQAEESAAIDQQPTESFSTLKDADDAAPMPVSAINRASKSPNDISLSMNVLSGLIKTNDVSKAVRDVLPDVMIGMDAIARLLLILYANREEYETVHGEDDTDNMEDMLESVLSDVGDTASELYERTSPNSGMYDRSTDASTLSTLS